LDQASDIRAEHLVAKKQDLNQTQLDGAESVNTKKTSIEAPSDESFQCPVCNKVMLRSEQTSTCSYCGKSEVADYQCPDGHYVCEECRLSTAEQLIKTTCNHTKETDPLKIANLLMKHPAIPMHGTEHHYLASCATLASMRNLGLFDIDPLQIDKAAALARLPPLGSCALWGACGAAIGVGIAFSRAFKANIMSGEERSIALNLVSQSLGEISKLGGPRCCKASVVLSLQVARKFLAERYSAQFDERNPICEFKNAEPCLRESCPFHHE